MNEHNATEQAYKHGYEKGRADAIEEFAVRLKAKNNTQIILWNDDIDTIAQEMRDEE